MYIDETKFDSVEEAQASQEQFKCQICEKFDTLEETINTQKAKQQQSDENAKALEDRIATLASQNEKQREEIERLIIRIVKIETENDELRLATREAEKDTTEMLETGGAIRSSYGGRAPRPGEETQENGLPRARYARAMKMGQEAGGQTGRMRPGGTASYSREAPNKENTEEKTRKKTTGCHSPPSRESPPYKEQTQWA